PTTSSSGLFRHSFIRLALLAIPLGLLGCHASPQPAPGTATPADEWPLLAYVGTYSAPLKDVLPTQVDLPPGNGRGIHCFRVDRQTGRWTPAGVTEMGNSPSCLAFNAAGDRLYSANETDRVGDAKEGTVS